MDRSYMISEIKKHTDSKGRPYESVNVTGGRAKLEDAPVKNLIAMYRAVCVSGRVKKEKPVVYNTQMEFNF